MKILREQLIRNFFNPQGTLDVVDLYSLLAPDITICEAETLPWGGNYRGLQGVGNFMSELTRHIISEVAIDEVYSCGNLVIVIGRSVGRVVKTGKQFSIRLTQLYTFDTSDKIKRVEFLADVNAYKEVLDQKDSCTTTYS